MVWRAEMCLCRLQFASYCCRCRCCRSFSFPGCSLIWIVSSTTPGSVSLVHGFTHDKSVPYSFSTPQARSQQQAEILIHLLKKLAPVNDISGMLDDDPMWIFSLRIWHQLLFQGSCVCANKIPKQQYLWTWCQGVVPNDAPRDFGSEVRRSSFESGGRFLSLVSDTCRQDGRERNVGP